MNRSIKALLAATFIGLAAMASVFASSAVLRQRAARDSRQIPTAERLFEPSVPVSAESVAHGRKLYLNRCAHCHGADARGDEGPDLHEVQMSDRYIAKIISSGIPHEMPAFGKKLGAAEITALIVYVRSLK